MLLNRFLFFSFDLCLALLKDFGEARKNHGRGNNPCGEIGNPFREVHAFKSHKMSKQKAQRNQNYNLAYNGRNYQPKNERKYPPLAQLFCNILFWLFKKIHNKTTDAAYVLLQQLYHNEKIYSTKSANIKQPPHNIEVEYFKDV